MESPKSYPATTMATSPLRESTRNTQTERIIPNNGWSTSSRISRLDSPLTSDSVPNHHYHRLPTQLARRQSSSYNHVRNNNLVSKSPFKVHNAFRPSRIPTPSRTPTTEDENKPQLGFKRRQSRGFQGLAKEQVVSKSPFLGDKRAAVKDHAPSTPTPAPPLSRLSISSPSSSPENTESRPSTPPPPSTPRNPRVADLSGVSPSSSPKSSLASTKRLHGPRSLSASPGSENGKRQRRKTVTFDERCDVLEFDQDDTSEYAIETDNDDDGYGLPEPLSPAISVSTDGSFISDASEKAEPIPVLAEEVPYFPPVVEERVEDHDMEQSGRMPRISRDEIRRRLMDQRAEEVQGRSLPAPQYTPDASFEASSQSLDVQPSVRRQVSPRLHPNSIPSLEESISTPLDFNQPGIDLGEMHSALDRLMLGVERGFGLDPAEGDSMENEVVTEGDLSGSANPSAVLSDISSDLGDVQVQRQDGSERRVKVEVADIPDVLSADEDTDEPITPPLTHLSDHMHPTSSKDDSMVHGSPPSMPGRSPVQGDNSILLASHDPLLGLNLTDTSVVDLTAADNEEEDGLALRMSTPPLSPRKNQQHPSEFPPPHRLEPSLSLPPLSFDPPSSSTSGTVNTSLTPSLSAALEPRGPKAVRDDTFLDRSSSTSSKESIPPPVPPKDPAAMRPGDDLVDARRREMRVDYEHDRPTTYHEGRPSKRRSLSTGDAEDLASTKPAAQRRADRLRDDRDINLLGIPLEQADENDALADVIDRELKIRRKPTVKERNRKYQLREHGNTIYASADDKVSHMSRAGDVDSGKAWRTVRRPSDMNEYSRQIKEYRSQQKPGKAHGKVFVKVLGVRGLKVPLPAEPTAFTCTLNNGIHFVTTPECRLSRDSRIEQEFELIEHSKLEFTLTLKVRRDPHIISQTKPPAVPLGAAPRPPSSSSRGVRNFFGVGNSPKKAQKVTVVAAARATPEPVEDNLARYLKPDGTLARAFISFKEIAKRCDTRLLETSFPLIGQRIDGSSAVANPWTMGEIVLQMFRLPPLPGIPPDWLPQSLEECHRGLRHINWHKVTYHEGVLTQNGGDCRTWRRRLLRVIGSNLVAFNDVTKKATATIDLKKAIAVEDDDRVPGLITSPASAAAARSRDEFEEVYRVERSFRLIFPNNEEICFFADSDEAKARWLEVFRALVGHIPPNPLWAELLWQRQEDLAKNPGPPASESAFSAVGQSAANPR